ncbi:hypothetical protein D3C86_1218510 [compost metagenome]
MRQRQVSARTHLEVTGAGANQLACAVVYGGVRVGVGRADGDAAAARGLRRQRLDRQRVGRVQVGACDQAQVPRSAFLQLACAVGGVKAVTQVTIDDQVATSPQRERAFPCVGKVAAQIPVAVHGQVAGAFDRDAGHHGQAGAQACRHSGRRSAELVGIGNCSGLDGVDRAAVVGGNAFEHRRARTGDADVDGGGVEVVVGGILLRTQPDLAAFVAGHVDGAALQVQLPACRFKGDAAAAKFAGGAGQQLRAGIHRPPIAAGDADGAAVSGPCIDGAGNRDPALVGGQAEVFHRGGAVQRDIALADAELP